MWFWESMKSPFVQLMASERLRRQGDHKPIGQSTNCHSRANLKVRSSRHDSCLSAPCCQSRENKKQACSLERAGPLSTYWKETFNPSLDLGVRPFDPTLAWPTRKNENGTCLAWCASSVVWDSVYRFWLGQICVELSQLVPNSFRTPRAHHIRASMTHSPDVLHWEHIWYTVGDPWPRIGLYFFLDLQSCIHCLT